MHPIDKLIVARLLQVASLRHAHDRDGKHQ